VASSAEAAARRRIEKDEFAQWENLEIFHVFCYVWYKYLNFDCIWRFEFSIDEISTVNFIHFQVKTFSPEL